uniref:Uncharacterized protein n=1 Tax=Daucus carota subsp. sativus TaxID=79200 RepID=A0A164UBC5_DAUCS
MDTEDNESMSYPHPPCRAPHLTKNQSAPELLEHMELPEYFPTQIEVVKKLFSESSPNT